MSIRKVAILQARTGSTRLPGKVLMDIGGKTMLRRVVERARLAKRVDVVVVATTTAAADDAVVDECERIGTPFFRGQEDDVLDRHYQAALAFGADAIVRITSDCPLADPELVDEVVRAYETESADYASNNLVFTYPRGVDLQVVALTALERAWRGARAPYERAGVVPYIWQHPEMFRLVSVEADADYSQHRWTVDTAEDLEFVREVVARLGEQPYHGWRDILALVGREPHLARINSHVRHKTPEEG